GGLAHTQGMTTRGEGYLVAALPSWVARPAVEVDDLERLAFAACGSSDRIERVRAESIRATVLWVAGAEGVAPSTGREERPVTAALAKAEFWAAMAAYDGGGTPEAVVRVRAEELGVVFRAPEPLPYRWANRLAGYDPAKEVNIERGYGVYRTLGWLLRHPDGYPACLDPPIPLPVRTPGGVRTER
ncbi:MAG: hypothetical protein ACRDQ9_16770, partial [Pseudonocardiaceae bacterium]